MGYSENSASTPLKDNAGESRSNYGSVKENDVYVELDNLEDGEDDFYHLSLDRELKRQKLIVIFTMLFCLLLMSTTVIVGLQLQSGKL